MHAGILIFSVQIYRFHCLQLVEDCYVYVCAMIISNVAIIWQETDQYNYYNSQVIAG